jgi:hypothetical protein
VQLPPQAAPPAQQAVETKTATASAPAQQATETAQAPSAARMDTTKAIAKGDVSDSEKKAHIDQAMTEIERLQGKNPTSEQLLTAYRIMLLDDRRFNPPSRYGLHSSSRDLYPKILADPTVKSTMNILGDGTDDGAMAIAIKDMNEWAGAISKSQESFGVPGIAGLSIKDLFLIGVLAFAFFQVMMNHKKIAKAVKGVLKR